MCVYFTGLVLCRVARFLLSVALLARLCSAQLILLLFPSITSHAHSFTHSLYFSGPRFRLDKLLLLLLLDIISSISKLKLPVLRGAGVISTGSGATSPPRCCSRAISPTCLKPAHNPISAVQSIAFDPRILPSTWYYPVGAPIPSHPVPLSLATRRLVLSCPPSTSRAAAAPQKLMHLAASPRFQLSTRVAIARAALPKPPPKRRCCCCLSSCQTRLPTVPLRQSRHLQRQRAEADADAALDC